MKALTICQPYSELICRGEKRVENRTWDTRYRGPLLIHAGKSRAWFDSDEDLIRDLGSMPPFGAIVASCNLVACIHIDVIDHPIAKERYPWLATHAHTNGPWCWILEDVVRIDPIPYRGAQGLFNIPEFVLEVA